MAVVQISKIQVRRGRKNSESGVPQLSSGEMAWTVDTQELFIGNGSVAEGAPYVGNSKVLTEHDNLLELIESYRYARPDPGITTSVFRTLQNKLDDYVNVKDFGAVGDGIADDTAAFQAAFDALFRNSNNEYRKRLYLPTGHYLIGGTLRIPSYTLIDGESQVGCILNVGASSIETTSTAGTAINLFESSDRSQNLVITNTTFRFTTGHFNLTGLKDSVFRNCSFRGPYSSLSAVAGLEAVDPLILLENGSQVGVSVNNISFDNCSIQGAYAGVGFTQPNAFDSNVKFINTKFKWLKKAIEITGGDVGQKNNWHVFDCDFEEIASTAFSSQHGVGTKIARSSFINCGNNVNQADNPETAIIVFGDQGNNTTEQCTFNRHQAAYNDIVLSDERMAHPEVLNSAKSILSDQINKDLYQQATFTPLAMFSTLNRKTVIEYIVSFQSGSARTGTITITVGDTLTDPMLSDSYASSCGDAQSELLEFSISLVDRSDSTTGSETMILNYKNPAAGLTPDKMYYFVSYGV
jgi:hypothetical protein